MIQSNRSNDIASSLMLQNTNSLSLSISLYPNTHAAHIVFVIHIVPHAIYGSRSLFLLQFFQPDKCCVLQLHVCSAIFSLFFVALNFQIRSMCILLLYLLHIWQRAFKFTFKSLFLLIFFVQTLHVVIAVRGPCRLHSSKHRLFRERHKQMHFGSKCTASYAIRPNVYTIHTLFIVVSLSFFGSASLLFDSEMAAFLRST